MSSSDFVHEDATLGDPALPAEALSPDDARALDAFFSDPTSLTPAGDPDAPVVGNPRVERIATLLAMLEHTNFSDSERDAMVEATMARVTLSRRRTGADPAGEPALIPADEDALEALITAGFQLSRVPSAMRERASHHMELFGLLNAGVAVDSSRDGLVETTLAKIQSSIHSEEGRLSLSRVAAQQADRGRFFSFLRSRELVSVAALLVIATALLTPLAQYGRNYARRAACAGNMAAAGVAFDSYAAANQDLLPLASASQPGNLFWNVGKQRDQSNSANLFLLRVLGHASANELTCGAHRCGDMSKDAWDWPDIQQVSYSFQNMFAKDRPRWHESNRVVVLADASPVIRRAVRHQVIYPFENSSNHEGTGQNVLFSDRSVQWLRTPVLLNNDNIWLPRQVEDVIAKMTKPREADPLRGNESPYARDDVFVGP